MDTGLQRGRLPRQFFDVLGEVASEIPVRLDTPKRKELLFERIQLASVYRTVWIAELHRDNQIVLISS